LPDFSIDVSHEVSREAVREQLPHLRPPLRLLAEELLAEESTIDFVTVDPAGHVALLLLGKEGEDASLLTRGLAHRAWVKARLEDWRQLAPDLGLAADANVSAVLLCPSFRPETLTAAEALGDAVQLVLCCSVHSGGGDSRVVFETLTGPAPGPAARGPRTAPSAVSARRPEPTSFRSGLTEADLQLTADERLEFS